MPLEIPKQDEPKEPDTNPDVFNAEAEAMKAIAATLVPLTPEARSRVIGWAVNYFHIGGRLW